MPASQSPLKNSQPRFESSGLSWAERARHGELNAVITPHRSERYNQFVHSVHLFGAWMAARLLRKTGIRQPILLDFGCGTGRFIRFFHRQGVRVVGTEVTAQMLAEARRFGLPEHSAITLTDGVAIPLRDESLDMIWVCGVLKYSLFKPGSACRGGSGQAELRSDGTTADEGAPADEPFTPVYREIAREMYRVLKPGSLLVNVEAYVDAPPEILTRDFSEVGFVGTQLRVLQRYEGRFERLCCWREWRRVNRRLVRAAGALGAALRFSFDDPRRPVAGFRDYLLVWRKPLACRVQRS